MGAQNFIFVSKFSQNVNFWPQILHCWMNIFRQEENVPTIFRQSKIYEKEIVPPAPTPFELYVLSSVMNKVGIFQ